MAFFEDLGKKINDFSQDVTQQTKELAEVARLNSMVSDKEKKITQLYQTIGQTYYDRHKNDASTEDFPAIGEINTLFQEIEQAKSEIRKIKGIRICSACGTELAPSTAFCTECGAKSPSEESADPASAKDETKKLCPGCGNTVNDGALFCNNCGTKLN